jgi:transmembrane sensor
MTKAQDALDRAAEWLVRQEDSGWSDADQAEFEGWLTAADGNKAAYWRLRHSWRRMDRLQVLGHGLPPAPAHKVSSRRWPVAAAIAATVAITVMIGVLHQPGSVLFPSAEATRFETSIGGRRHLELSDGSSIELNTNSSVRVTLSADVRHVWLERGEAFFAIAKLHGVPFVVHSGDETITVLGTKFAVRQDTAKVVVSVVEGRVQLKGENSDRSGRPVILAKGDSAIVSGNATLVSAKSIHQIGDALAWREGRLVFDGTTLAEAAAEFNRYNRRQLVIADPDTASIRIGGSFAATSPDVFARLLKDAYGLHVVMSGETIQVSR